MNKRSGKKVCCIMLIILVLSLFATILVGCNNRDKMSTNTLDITSNLDNYNEETRREEMMQKRDICLAVDGNSDYGIIISGSASQETVTLADEFSLYLNKIVGSNNKFTVFMDDADNLPTKYLSLGETTLSGDILTDKLVNDGYLIKSVNDNIYFKTLEEEYLYNAVFSFLENDLECMFVRDDFEYVPNFPTIYLDKFDEVSNPEFAWRKVYQWEVAQNGWYRKLKQNGTVDGAISIFKNWGTWSHTFFRFVPPDTYFNEHPDYYSVVDGKPRQLCLTNPNVYPIIEANMKKAMDDNPSATYWDFSIMDNHDYCKCENCAKALKETGSMMGTTLPIINKLARKFPDKIISTLAYYDNEKVPKGIECEDNVNIVIAPIQTGQLYSYNFGGTKAARRAKEVIEAWGKVAKNILIWDYVTDFRHMLMPYPNFDVQQDNHDLYLNNNVTAVFHQGSCEPNHEMACLRAYVLSHQMWDNSVDINTMIAKYVNVTYGKAAKNVAEYLDRCNSELKEKGNNLDLYDKPAWHQLDYLSPKNNKYYLKIINEAIELEKDNERIVKQLEEIKINILYATMNEGGYDINRKEAAFEEFITLVREHNVPQPYEGNPPTMEDYINDIYPSYLTGQKLALSACVILPILGVPSVAFGIYMFIKWRKKKKATKAGLDNAEVV